MNLSDKFLKSNAKPELAQEFKGILKNARRQGLKNEVFVLNTLIGARMAGFAAIGAVAGGVIGSFIKAGSSSQ
ncbi:MAG: hypothetical protein MZU79_02015 [Anaerotruncus sp.]|nr:hypothetical protein [Anaerotruncus sp.]